MSVVQRIAIFAADAELEAKIIKVLKNHGFTGKATANRGTKFPYKGILTQSLVDNLFRDMVKIDLTPGGTRVQPTWYDRDQNILVRIGGETGKHYYAELVHMDR
jgi:hypothetical protein